MCSTTRLTLEFKDKPDINETQKNIIEGTLKFIFDEISELKPNDALFILNSIKSFDVLKNESVTKRSIYMQKKVGVRDGVISITNILLHKFPQNRCIGDASATGNYERYPEGVKDGIVYYWKNGFGSEVGSEAQGILGLTARNDLTAYPITAYAVKKYVFQLIHKEIEKHQKNAEHKDEVSLSTKICRFSLYKLFEKENLDDWISLGNKEYCDWIKSDPYQRLYAHQLYLQLVFGLALYVEEKKVKKEVYAANPIIDKNIDSLVDSIRNLHDHLRLQNGVDCYHFFNIKMLSGFLFPVSCHPSDVFAEINKSLSTLRLKAGAHLPIEIRSQDVHFHFTLRELGRHVVTSLVNWRQLLPLPSLPMNEVPKNTVTFR